MQPQSPDPKFDFMLKDNQKPKRRLALPGMSKPVKIILGVVLAVFILIIISSTLSGRNKGATQPIINAMARGQETLRVTHAVQLLNLQDPTTQAVAATTLSSLTSDQQQLKVYLANNHTKLSAALLAADLDKTTDAQMLSASQNNNLDQAYKTYLQQSLTKYQADLQIAFKLAGPKGKTILKNAYDGAGTLLANPPLKS